MSVSTKEQKTVIKYYLIICYYESENISQMTVFSRECKYKCANSVYFILHLKDIQHTVHSNILLSDPELDNKMLFFSILNVNGTIVVFI